MIRFMVFILIIVAIISFIGYSENTAVANTNKVKSFFESDIVNEQ